MYKLCVQVTLFHRDVLEKKMLSRAVTPPNLKFTSSEAKLKKEEEEDNQLDKATYLTKIKTVPIMLETMNTLFLLLFIYS